MDMHVAVGAVALSELRMREGEESSARVRERVVAARARQRTRYVAMPGVSCNAHVAGRWLDAHSTIDPDARALLLTAAGTLSLSARGYHRVMKVSRTIADLDGDEAISAASVAEALHYRPAAPCADVTRTTDLDSGHKMVLSG